jgi:cysteine desulfurase / selenocysteine lyase
MFDVQQLIGNTDAFPVLRHWGFFNHAGVAPLPRTATDQIRRYANQAQMQGYIGSHWYSDIEHLRNLSAGLIGAHRDEIAFVKNTSEGIATVAQGIDWQWGDVVVTTNVEYPANLYPWMDLVRTRGIRLEKVSEVLRADGAHEVPIDAILKAAENPRCRMVALSMVEYASGQRHDVARIGQFCRDNGKLFCVDAIQAVGVMPVDVVKMNIDFLSADGHKWMLGPEGAGIFYCRRELLEHTRPLMIGWMNVVNAHDYGAYDFTLRADAGRFECGTYNVPGLLGLLGALTLIEQVGVEVIFARVQVLLERLAEGLRLKNYQIVSPRESIARSGILSFKSAVHSQEQIINTLRQARIEIARREGRLRVSPHFYNTEQQMDMLVELLP